MQPRITRTTETPTPARAAPPRARSTTVRIDALPDGSYRITGATGSAVASTSGGFVRAFRGALADAAAHGVPPVPAEPEVPEVPEPAPRRRTRPLGARRPGDGWGAGQQRPDVHPADRWTRLPGGAWLSPGGRTYGPHTAQARRAAARLGRVTEAGRGDGVATTDSATTRRPVATTDSSRHTDAVVTTDSGATGGVATTGRTATQRAVVTTVRSATGRRGDHRYSRHGGTSEGRSA